MRSGCTCAKANGTFGWRDGGAELRARAANDMSSKASNFVARSARGYSRAGLGSEAAIEDQGCAGEVEKKRAFRVCGCVGGG